MVLDPFCGVASTCIAALRARRHFVGIDNNPEYIEKGRKRVEAYVLNESQTKLSPF